MVMSILALSTLLLALPAYGQEANCPAGVDGANTACCYEAGACNNPEDCNGLVVQYAVRIMNQRISAGCVSFLSSCIPGYASTCYNSKCFGFIGQGCPDISTNDCSGCTAANAVGPDYVQGVRQSSNNGQTVAIAPQAQDVVPAPAPDTPTPDVSTPDAPVPDVPTPDASAPDVPTPDAPAPDVPTPDAPAPAVATSDAPTPTITPPVPSPPSGGGTSCIAAHQVVTVEGQGSKRITELKPGNTVLTDTGFREYIGNIHGGRVSSTLTIHTDNGKSIELTADHLIKTDRGFLHASRLCVGSLLVDSKVVRIENSSSFVVSPLTRSGTIIVNDIVLSCYANIFSHNIANFMLIPVTTNVTKDISKYFSVLAAIYNAFPKYIKHYIAATDTIVL